VIEPIFIDSDNALGSPCGDVDDAFAIAALLRSGVPVAALASASGNTSERGESAFHK
jgi:inosine-uridine nucleoside N-ribohydrolase